MEAFQAGFPGLTVFLTFGHSLPRSISLRTNKPLAECASGLLAPFLDGYRELRRCDREWLAAVPDMLALQRSMNYALFHQYRDRALLDDDTLDRWSRFRRDIEADTPVVQLDFASF